MSTKKPPAAAPAAPPPADLIDTDAARRLLGGDANPISRETLEDLVAGGLLHQYRLSPRSLRYSRSQVEAYLAASAVAGQAACRKIVAKKRPGRLPAAPPDPAA